MHRGLCAGPGRRSCDTLGAHRGGLRVSGSDLEKRVDVGLHDSLLGQLAVDLEARTLEFVLSVCVGDVDSPDMEERERRRKARIRLSGLVYFAVDPPDPKYPYDLGEATDVDACGPDEQLSGRYPLPRGAFSGRLFVTDWNAFIHFAATEASLSWLEPE